MSLLVSSYTYFGPDHNYSDHVPFRNSKLTRMLQPSLSGDARISVICAINPDANAVAESTSTLLFAQRIKKVALNAQKKEVIDADALIERYRKEIEDLKLRLAQRETEAPDRKRRLSARQVCRRSNISTQHGEKLLMNLFIANGRNEGDERPQLAHPATHQAHSY